MTTTDPVKELEQRYDRLSSEHSSLKTGLVDIEEAIMRLLWRSRGTVTVDDMAKITGWSRQTIYNRWRKFRMEES